MSVLCSTSLTHKAFDLAGPVQCKKPSVIKGRRKECPSKIGSGCCANAGNGGIDFAERRGYCIVERNSDNSIEKEGKGPMGRCSEMK